VNSLAKCGLLVFLNLRFRRGSRFLKAVLEQKDDGTGEWEEVTSRKTLDKRVGNFEKKFSFSKVDLDSHENSRAKIFAAEPLEEEDVARVTVHTFGEFGLHITLEVVDRMLAAMIGSSLMLGLLALLGLTPTFAETVGFVDLGSLGLLFGMMIVVGTLSNTGVFEVTTRTSPRSLAAQRVCSFSYSAMSPHSSPCGWTM